MSASTNTRRSAAQDTPNSLHSRWHEPTPAVREWYGPVSAPSVLGGAVKAVGLLHRIERWERGGDGWIYARCGAKARLWMAVPSTFADRSRCLHCEDVDDARKAA